MRGRQRVKAEWVLIVEGDPEAAQELSDNLQRNGYSVRWARTGEQALHMHGEADLVLLTLDLPDVDGLEVCRAVRATGRAPVIAFTEGASELDRVLGLQAGADDCMDKPYGLRELLARMEAVLRRTRTTAEPPAPQSIGLGSLWIDAVAREVWLHGERIEMTRKEFDLLYHLASRPGEVTSRAELMAEVWEVPAAHTLNIRASRTIDTHISALRSKLGNDIWITTVRGVGFRFCAGQGLACGSEP
ncbi:response regulator transcription factor [Streptomyces cyaneofuscatus]|uniref:response regulator transcription factor n=1 Tax=Streptomyces cyaneofuscatus TaxID=66883 RepID=UPI0013DD6849|nr:response regulator transcription factor [Streptomyces cyaneofuscatus]NDZ68020.1 response regulator transcription factor [Streptomyces cyaneofuscatus]